MDAYGEDRLSELPLSLILLILSFLPMRDVVSTTLVSKYWRNLWTTIPCLNFCNVADEVDEVRNFVNSALKMWKGTNILKFKFAFYSDFDVSLAADIDLWVRFAVEHRVQELTIQLYYEFCPCDAVEFSSEAYCVPQCLYSCSSLTKLTLVGCNLRIDESPSWNQLQSLMLEGLCYSECLINRVMLGSPRLEVFELCLLEGCENSLSIRSTSLKRLKIEKRFYDYYNEPSLDKVVSICCPNLETIELCGVPYSKCLFTDPLSITDVALWFFNIMDDFTHFGKAGYEFLGEALTKILPTIQHVERLTLSVCSVKVLCAFQRKGLLSPLPNVEFLKISVTFDKTYGIKYSEIMNFLGCFPNLKMLVIHDRTPPVYRCPPYFIDDNYLEFEETDDLSESSLPLHLKIIQITSLMSSHSIFRAIVCLLRQAIVLEKFVIRMVRVRSFPPRYLFYVARRLRKLPRSSPTARLISIY